MKQPLAILWIQVYINKPLADKQPLANKQPLADKQPLANKRHLIIF